MLHYSYKDNTVYSVLSDKFPYSVSTDNKEITKSILELKPSNINELISLLIHKFSNNLAKDILLTTIGNELIDDDSKDQTSAKILMCLRDKWTDSDIDDGTELLESEKKMYLRKIGGAKNKEDIYDRLPKPIQDMIGTYLPTKHYTYKKSYNLFSKWIVTESNVFASRNHSLLFIWNDESKIPNNEQIRKDFKEFMDKLKITNYKLSVYYDSVSFDSDMETINTIKEYIKQNSSKFIKENNLLNETDSQIDELKYIDTIEDESYLIGSIEDAFSEIENNGLPTTHMEEWKNRLVEIDQFEENKQLEEDKIKQLEELLDEIESFIDGLYEEQHKIIEKLKEKYKYDINDVDMIIDIIDHFSEDNDEDNDDNWEQSMKMYRDLLKSDLSLNGYCEKYNIDTHYPSWYKKGPSEYIDYKPSNKYKLDKTASKNDILKRLKFLYEKDKNSIFVYTHEDNSHNTVSYNDICKYPIVDKVKIIYYKSNKMYIIYDRLN